MENNEGSLGIKMSFNSQDVSNKQWTNDRRLTFNHTPIYDILLSDYPRLPTPRDFSAAFKEYPTISKDEAISIWAYSLPSPQIFTELNDVLFLHYVYRGTGADWATKKQWKVGEVVRWFPFTSCSRDKFVSLSFCNPDEEHVLFKILSWTGRKIELFSQIPDEQEVLFRCVTDFEVKGVQRNGKCLCVELEEVTTIKPGYNRFLLWVDDNPENNRDLLAMCEWNEINIVIRKSTESALAFLDDKENSIALFDKYGEKIKIVSDMGRLEEGRFIDNAGIIFLKELRNRKKKWFYNGIFAFFVGNPKNEYYEMDVQVFTNETGLKNFLNIKETTHTNHICLNGETEIK